MGTNLLKKETTKRNNSDDMLYFINNYMNYDNEKLINEIIKEDEIYLKSKEGKSTRNNTKRTKQRSKHRREAVLHNRHALKKIKSGIVYNDMHVVELDDNGKEYLKRYSHPPRATYHKKLANRTIRQKISKGKDISPQYKKEYSLWYLVY